MNQAKLCEQLVAIADELDTLQVREDELFALRRALWKQGRAAGMKSHELARPSRVRPVTVRNLTT